MPTLQQLRVEIDDRPGSLARAASVLAEDGVNILSIAIHEVDGDVVVDELVVEVPDRWDLVMARERLDACGAHLLSSAVVTQREDPVVTALGWVRELVAWPDSDDRLGAAVGRAAAATRACVLPVDRARHVSAGRLALERGGAVVQRTADLPIQLATAGASLRWLVALPDDEAAPRLVAFATRPLSLRFTSTEIARSEAVMRLWRGLSSRHTTERRAPGSGG